MKNNDDIQKIIEDRKLIINKNQTVNK